MPVRVGIPEHVLRRPSRCVSRPARNEARLEITRLGGRLAGVVRKGIIHTAFGGSCGAAMLYTSAEIGEADSSQRNRVLASLQIQ